MDGIPANHRLAERMLIQFVRSGEWRIDEQGQMRKYVTFMQQAVSHRLRLPLSTL